MVDVSLVPRPLGAPRACGRETSSVTAYGGDTFPKGEG